MLQEVSRIATTTSEIITFNANWDGTITFRAQTTLAGTLSVQYTAKPIVFVAENGYAAYGVSSTRSTPSTVYGFNFLSGTMVKILSGIYATGPLGGAYNGTLLLGDGCGTVLLTGDAKGSGTIVISNATLRASSIASGLTVKVGACGATFDTNGGSMTVNCAVANVTGETGALLLTGGGTVTFKAAPSVKLLVQNGTTVVADTKEIADAILESGIALVGATSTGSYTVLTCNEALTGADVSNVTCGIAANAAPGSVGGTDDKSIFVTVSSLNPGWYIGPADGSLSAGANWSDGIVPTSGNATIFCSSPATLSKGETFAPSSITFAEGSAKVTVTGDAIDALGSITVLNGAENVFSNAVTFTGNIDVTATCGHVRFAGGATGIGIRNHTSFCGVYNITATGDWNPPNGSTLKSGSELRLLEGTYKDHNGRLTIESGATVKVKNAKMTGSGNYLINQNYGVFMVTNEYSCTSSAGNLQQKAGDITKSVYVANKIKVSGSDGVLAFGKSRMIVGPGGIKLANGGYVRIVSPGACIIGAYADWTLSRTDADASTTTKGLQKTGDGDTTVTFDTTDYHDSTIGRTITAESGIGGNSAARANMFSVVVQGKGRFEFVNTGTNDYDFAAGLTVKDSATVAVKPGARPGRGTVTLNDTAMLEIAESGAVTLGGALTLGDNATLAFNFTARDSAPVLSVATGATLPATVNVKISKADDVTSVKGGTYVLTSGCDFTGKTVNIVDKPDWVQSVTVDAEGNLVLTTASKGLIISFY